MLKNSLGGGSFIRPMFVDFPTIEIYRKSISQFMMGTNMMAAPVITQGETRKEVYFPNDLFYNFDSGALMNPKGEGSVYAAADLSTLPLFLRAGSIVQVQKVPNNITNIIEMRKQPFQLKVGLDKNLWSYGRIMIDDGYCKYHYI